MGCLNSNSGIPSCDVLIDNCEFDKPAHREVTDYPFYKTRLTKIDYKAVLEKDELFEDPYFPADVSSILDPNMPTAHAAKQWSEFTWKRPSEHYGEGQYTLYEKANPQDILQGKCGDCYFLSSLCALSEVTGRIDRVIIQDLVNKQGCYAVRIYISGEVHDVVIDDRFPFDEKHNNWAFSRCDKEHEIWVLVIEKAWAKLFGNYQRIEGGTAGEAFYPLTGCPTEFFIHDDKDDKDAFWKYLKVGDDANYPMVCSVASQAEYKSGLTAADMKKMGLIDNHAYSLIHMREITLDDGVTKQRLCAVRNPWGQHEWKGKWCDDSKEWTEKCKAQVAEYAPCNDGLFWMTWTDYLKYYYITTMCYYKTDYIEQTVSDQHKQLFDKDATPQDCYAAVRFDVPEDSTHSLCLTLDQIDARFVDSDMSGNYSYGQVICILTKVIHKMVETGKDEQGQPIMTKKKFLRFIDGYNKSESTATIAHKGGIKKGTYIFFYQATFDPDQWQKIVCSGYHEFDLKLHKIDTTQFGVQRFNQLYEMLSMQLSVEGEEIY